MFQISEKSLDLKKSRKVPNAQDLVKEMRLTTNTSHTWNRPRCGVPDFPAQKEVHYQERHRHRRFVLYGGRLDKTDLTYRYDSEELGKSSIDWLKSGLYNYFWYYFCLNAGSKYKFLINNKYISCNSKSAHFFVCIYYKGPWLGQKPEPSNIT